MPSKDSFVVLQIFMPIVAFAVIITCCSFVCKAFQRAREERETQARAVHHPSVYILPLSLANQEQGQRPPHYSTVDHYSSPPPYDELVFKPDFIPHEPPPAYTESTLSPPYDPRPVQTCSATQQVAF